MTRTWYYTDNNASNNSTGTGNPSYKYNNESKVKSPIPSTSIVWRRLLAIPCIVLLYTAAVPFTPIAWVIGDISGALLFDSFIAGIIILSALYFQFVIAGLMHSIAIVLPNPLPQQPEISAGRINRKVESRDLVFFYHPSNYYVYVAGEIALLVVAEWSGYEYLRRVIVMGIVAALWAVGWVVTPQSQKEWAWGYIKMFWFWIALDVLRGVMGDSTGRRRRR